MEHCDRAVHRQRSVQACSIACSYVTAPTVRSQTEKLRHAHAKQTSQHLSKAFVTDEVSVQVPRHFTAAYLD